MLSISRCILTFYKQLVTATCCLFLYTFTATLNAAELPVWLINTDDPVFIVSQSLQQKLDDKHKVNMLEPKTLRLKAHSSYWLVIDLNKLPSNQDYVVYIAEPNLTWKKFYLLDDLLQIQNKDRLASLVSLSSVRPHWLVDHNRQNRWALLNFQHEHAISIEVGVVSAKTFEVNLHQTILGYGAILGVLVLCMFVCGVYYFISKRFKYLTLNAYFVLVTIGFMIDNGLTSFFVSGLEWSAKWLINQYALCFGTYFLYHFAAINRLKSHYKSVWIALLSVSIITTIMASLLPQLNLQSSYIFSCIVFLMLAGIAITILYKGKGERTRLRLLMVLTLSVQAFSWLVWNGFGVGNHTMQNVIVLFTSLAISSLLLLKDRHRISSFNYSMTHDADTKLPNKQLLLSEIMKKVAHKQHFSVMLFRPHVLVNARATFGYEHANNCIVTTLDVLTQQLESINALRLETHVDQGVWIARVDDSIFACVVMGELELSHIEQFACLIHGVFEEGITHNNVKLVDSVDIGVAHYPLHGNTARQILQCAIQAMSEKRLQGERWRMFDLESARLSEQRLLIAASLKLAIEEDQLNLHFQPQICLETGDIVGCEALLRWHHPALGAIGPDTFIPIAESSGVINQLTEWVVAKGIEWQARFCELIPEHVISINISAKDLLNKDLPVLFITKLNELGVSADSVMLELTESATLEESKNIKITLDDYRLIGVKLAIDDFGTGYSSLAYLSQLGFDEVKIDKQFVLNLAFSLNDQSICKATCDIAKTLGAKVVAEGIEDPQSLAILQRYGCQIGQGYYFSKPLEADDYLLWIKNFKSVDVSHDVKAHLVD